MRRLSNDTEHRALSLRELSFSDSRLDALRVVASSENDSRFCIRHVQGYRVAFCTSLHVTFDSSSYQPSVRAANYGKRCLLNLNGRPSHRFQTGVFGDFGICNRLPPPPPIQESLGILLTFNVENLCISAGCR